MNIAITGGTGFLGGHFIRYLVNRNHFPTVIARGVSRRAETIRRIPNINFMPIPLNDDSKLFQAFKNCEAVAHLAGINRESERGDFKEVHVESTLRVIHAARKAGIKKILYVSYLKARPGCFSKYHESKWEAEELIRKSGLNYTILKPGMIFGPDDHMITKIARVLDNYPFFAPLGIIEPKIRPVAVEDMLKIMAASLLENRLSGKTVAVLGPEEMTLSGAVKRVAKAKRKFVVFLPMPAIVHLGLALTMEKLSKDPLVSVAQVRMLSEGMSKALKECDELPDNLKAETYLTEQLISDALSRGSSRLN